MNVLYINHYAGSPYHGMEYRPYYLAREWQRLGEEVQIVAASFSHLRQHNPTKDSKQTSLLCPRFFAETIDDIHYLWCTTPSYQGNGGRRVLNILTFVYALAVSSHRLSRTYRPDVVIASSTYPLDIYPAALIARHTRARLIFEVHDLWPLTPIEVGGLSPHHPFIWLLQKAERFAYRHADLVVSILPNAKAYMVQQGMAPEKFCPLPNGIAVDQWHASSLPLPQEHALCLSHLRAQGQWLLAYAGSFGVANALDNLLAAAARLTAHPIAFVLVGDGPEKISLMKQAVAQGLSQVHFLPPVQKKLIPALLSQMDALFIGWRPLALYRFGISPNKLFDYMMAAKPIIHALSQADDLVASAEAGFSVAADDPLALAQACLKMQALPADACQRLGENGRRYVLAHHDYRVLAKRFLQYYYEQSPNRQT